VVTSDHLAFPRPHAEPRLREQAPDVRARHEPDFRIEALADDESLHLQAVAVALEVELPPVAGRVSASPRRAALGPIAVEGKIPEKKELAVDAVDVVGA